MTISQNWFDNFYNEQTNRKTSM